MEEVRGVVKHVLLVKFKDGIPSEEIEQKIKKFANLVNLTKQMKAFHWGTNVSIENLNQGFTHIFETTFESLKDIEEYIPHPAHVEFVDFFKPSLDKLIVIDYKPTVVRC